MSQRRIAGFSARRRCAWCERSRSRASIAPPAACSSATNCRQASTHASSIGSTADGSTCPSRPNLSRSRGPSKLASDQRDQSQEGHLARGPERDRLVEPGDLPTIDDQEEGVAAEALESHFGDGLKCLWSG